jgi:hypothetical protein
MAGTATARKASAPARKPGAAATRAPARRTAPPARPPRKPARKPARARPRTSRSLAGGGHLIPLAVGRTAVAVSQIPDTRAIKRLTRGRAWIALLGVLLIGIVGLNVATLGLTASAGDIERQIQTLGQENSVLRARLAQRLSSQRVEGKAAALGLAVPSPGEITYRDAGPDAVREAARRLAAASG